MKHLILPAFCLMIITASCKKNDGSPAEAPPAAFTYSSTDSMQIDSRLQGVDPQFYADVNGKIYTQVGTRTSAFFTEAAAGLLLQLTDSSQPGYATAVTIQLANKTAAGVNGVYNFRGNSNVCVRMWQDLGSAPGSGTWVQSAACENALQGTITINYDAATQTLSGSIEKLQYPFAVYIPAYLAGRPHTLAQSGFLTGSSRTQNIRFQYVRRR